MTVLSFGYVSHARKGARDAVRLSNLSSLHKALAMYYDDNGYYPDLGSSCFESDTIIPECYNDLYDILSPTYISAIDNNDSFNKVKNFIINKVFASTPATIQDPLFNENVPAEWSYMYQQNANNNNPQSYVLGVKLELTKSIHQVPNNIYTGCWTGTHGNRCNSYYTCTSSDNSFTPENGTGC